MNLNDQQPPEKTGEEDRLRTMEAGFDEHLVKPVNMQEFKVALRKAMTPPRIDVAE
jgi:DNA-binding response OmpR family regulator